MRDENLVCLFGVCYPPKLLTTYGKKRLQTFTDCVEPTQECPAVVKVAHLAILWNFALFFQFSLCAEPLYLIWSSGLIVPVIDH